MSGGADGPANEAHDLVMNVFGEMGKGERNGVKVRVRTATVALATATVALAAFTSSRAQLLNQSSELVDC